MAEFIIIGWEHDLLNRIYAEFGDAPFAVQRLVEVVGQKPGPPGRLAYDLAMGSYHRDTKPAAVRKAAKLVRQLVVAGWLREYKPLEGEAKKPRRFQVSDRRVPEQRPPWVVFLMGVELGDPIQYASCHKVRVATSDPDKAFYFSSEKAARSYVANAEERFQGFRPRVVNFDSPTLVPGTT